MPVLEFDFYDRADLSTPLGTLDETDVLEMGIRAALHDLGAGHLVVNKAQATSTLLQRGRIVKVRAPVIGTNPVWGFVLRDQESHLISYREEGGEVAEFSGPGLLHLLSDARLPTQPYAPGQPALGSYDVPGYWTWVNEPYGAILVRGIEEGQNVPGTPLGGIGVDFSRTHDSAGVPWVLIAEKFQTPIGTDILTLANRMAAAGDLYLTYDPLTDTISAYQTYGTDVSGAVSFTKGVNVLTELTRETRAQPFTHLIQKDADGNYSTEVISGFSGIARYGFAEAPQTNDDAMLNRIAQQTLQASTGESEEYEVEVAPTSYLPWVDFRPGDTVGVHTGTGSHDLNATTQKVMAVRLVVDDAARNDDAERQKRSLHVVAELAYRPVHTFIGGQSPPTAIGQPSYPPQQLCGPTVAGDPGSGAAAYELWDWIGGTAEPIAHPAGGSTNAFLGTSPQLGGLDYYVDPGSSADSGLIAATAGVIYNFRCLVRRPFDFNVRVRVKWYTNVGADISNNVLGVTGGAGWQTMTGSFTAPPTAARMKITKENAGTGLSTALDFDEVEITSGAVVDPSDPQNPYAGTSPLAARCDHTHEGIGESVPHATEHEDGGTDELEIAALATAETDTAKVLHPNGSGGVAWGTDATGGGGGAGAVVASGSTTTTFASGAAAVSIDLDPSSLTKTMAQLMPVVRVHERTDGSSAADPGDVWYVNDVWFKRDDGATTGIPNDLRVRIRRAVGTASGYSVRIDWALIALA